jgi:hypothetical protein
MPFPILFYGLKDTEIGNFEGWSFGCSSPLPHTPPMAIPRDPQNFVWEHAAFLKGNQYQNCLCGTALTKACTIHALKEQYHDIFVSSVFLQKTSGPNRRVQERFKFFFSVELFVFVIDFPVMNKPESRLEFLANAIFQT